MQQLFYIEGFAWGKYLDSILLFSLPMGKIICMVLIAATARYRDYPIRSLMEIKDSVNWILFSILISIVFIRWRVVLWGERQRVVEVWTIESTCSHICTCKRELTLSNAFATYRNNIWWDYGQKIMSLKRGSVCLLSLCFSDQHETFVWSLSSCAVHCGSCWY